MTCTNCFNNCDPSPISDQCVKYTGPDNSTIGIKSGDALYCVEQSLIDYVTGILTGSTITVDVTASCALLTGLINADKSLKNVLQAYANAICTLKTSVDSITPTAISYDAGCLTLPANPKTEDVVKALVTKICSVDSRVTTIENSYVKSSDVTTIVQDYIKSTTTSTSTNIVQENTKMPKYVAMDYHGPLSNFDSSGKGISSAGYDKVYLCIGQTVNGFTLPDYRGRGSAMINVNVPGGAMDTDVDPSQTANAGYQITLNGKKGKYTHALSSSENGPHTHTITDPGHKHWATVQSRDFKNNSDRGPDHTNDGLETRSFQTDIAYTGITINTSGNGQPHNNLHPVVGSIKIMYVP